MIMGSSRQQYIVYVLNLAFFVKNILCTQRHFMQRFEVKSCKVLVVGLYLQQLRSIYRAIELNFWENLLVIENHVDFIHVRLFDNGSQQQLYGGTFVTLKRCQNYILSYVKTFDVFFNNVSKMFEIKFTAKNPPHSNRSYQMMFANCAHLNVHVKICVLIITL